MPGAIPSRPGLRFAERITVHPDCRVAVDQGGWPSTTARAGADQVAHWHACGLHHRCIPTPVVQISLGSEFSRTVPLIDQGNPVDDALLIQQLQAVRELRGFIRGPGGPETDDELAPDAGQA